MSTKEIWHMVASMTIGVWLFEVISLVKDGWHVKPFVIAAGCTLFYVTVAACIVLWRHRKAVASPAPEETL